jgi:hypothetical protein
MRDEDATREVFPIEIRISQLAEGCGRIAEWPQRSIPAFDVSFASTGEAGVAIARPALSPAAPDAPGIGIGIAEIPGEDGKPATTGGLSGQELAVLDTAQTTEPGSTRDLWTCRFLAAKQAAANASGIAPSSPTVVAATPAVVTVDASGRTYQIRHRELRDSRGKTQERRYVVAWIREGSR